jgi:hypothetical protein
MGDDTGPVTCRSSVGEVVTHLMGTPALWVRVSAFYVGSLMGKLDSVAVGVKGLFQ